MLTSCPGQLQAGVGVGAVGVGISGYMKAPPTCPMADSQPKVKDVLEMLGYFL